MSDLKTQQREWLTAIVQATGRSLTAIARKAGVHESTLTRFMNNMDKDYTLSERTIRLISEAEHLPFGKFPEKMGEWMTLPDSFLRSSVWDTEEVAPLDPEDTLDPIMAKVLAVFDNTDKELWKLQSNKLLLAGYKPDDVFIVERAASPQSGNVVIAEVSSGLREKISFQPRIFIPPFIMTANHPLDRPLLVDNHSVRIVATVVLTIRPRG